MDILTIWVIYQGAVSFGTFSRDRNIDRGVFRIDILYFSNLRELKSLYIRNFITFRNTIGVARRINESINLDEPAGLYGFTNNVVSGRNKALLKLENVIYLPFNIIGFKFATIVFMGFGIVDDSYSFIDNKLHQVYGLGLLIRNENLVFDNFQFSVGFYPVFNGERDIFKFNPVSFSNLQFNDFYLNKPGIISYQ